MLIDENDDDEGEKTSLDKNLEVKDIKEKLLSKDEVEV